MDKKPLVTIITVTFNLIKSGREKYFRQCVKSVHNQSYENVEHIIIDGASNDGTVELIKEYVKKDWIKYISEPDRGIYEAMNKGIKMAKGKYIAFLNSDDFYHNNNAIKLSVLALEKNDADFSYANYILLNKNKKKIVARGELEKFLYTMPFGHPTMFTKVSVIKEEGGFNERYKLPADYDLIIRLILKDYKSVYLNKEIVTYRIGGLGSTTDHSDEIAQLYFDNYSAFQDFSCVNQARKIMYELKLPYGFMLNFTNYIKDHKNIDKNKIIQNLINNLIECREKNDINDLKNREEGISVFLSSDNNYAPFVATTICSIMSNTNSFVNFYILDGGISWENAEKIKEVKKLFSNFSIEFIEIDTAKEFKNFPTRLHFSIDMYTRFLIPELKPDLKKVIYSDVDVIFNGDIKDLMNENLEDYSIGAVPYLCGYVNPDKREIKSYHKRLKLSYGHKYFESGLLLIDVDSWKKNDITKKLIFEAGNNSIDVILTPDQDVFNIVFDNNYKKLDNKYIVVPHRKKIMQTDISTRQAFENPFIIHYAGSCKPWKDPKMELASYFWKYAKMTLFYEELIFDFYSKENLIKERKIYKIILEFKKKIRNISTIKNKILFVVFSPRKFLKKYSSLFLSVKSQKLSKKNLPIVRNSKLTK